jgi:type III secretion protein J
MRLVRTSSAVLALLLPALADAGETGLAALVARAGIVPSPTVERAALSKARAEEVELALLQVDGVVDAQVQVLLPDTPAGRPRAAVLVKHTQQPDGGAPISEREIRLLALPAAEGLKLEAVSVVLSVARPPPPQLVRVGPLLVASGSRTLLVGTLGSLAALCLALSLHVIRQIVGAGR